MGFCASRAERSNFGCFRQIVFTITATESLRMNKEKLIQFFQSTGLVNSQKAEEIAAQFTARSISKNEYFLKEGKVSNEYLFLEHGFMRAFAYNIEGDDVTTNF